MQSLTWQRASKHRNERQLRVQQPALALALRYSQYSVCVDVGTRLLALLLSTLLLGMRLASLAVRVVRKAGSPFSQQPAARAVCAGERQADKKRERALNFDGVFVFLIFQISLSSSSQQLRPKNGQMASKFMPVHARFVVTASTARATRPCTASGCLRSKSFELLGLKATATAEQDPECNLVTFEDAWEVCTAAVHREKTSLQRHATVEGELRAVPGVRDREAKLARSWLRPPRPEHSFCRSDHIRYTFFRHPTESFYISAGYRLVGASLKMVCVCMRDSAGGDRRKQYGEGCARENGVLGIDRSRCHRFDRASTPDTWLGRTDAGASANEPPVSRSFALSDILTL